MAFGGPARAGPDEVVFTTSELLETEDFKDSGVSGCEVAERFLRASIKGWEYAVENQEEAVSIVLESCGDTCAGSGSTQSSHIHQTWQMARVAELVKPEDDTAVGAMNEDAFDRSAGMLGRSGCSPNRSRIAT